jgi:2-desacetyl-2-hydroxyethyl bacteriochlorophyllide A dehydrogenase
MKAIVCDRPGQLSVETRPAPEPRPGEALVRIRRVGVCGTDYHIFGGRHPFLEYPRVMGHELAGEIVSVPEGSAFKVGQIVAINPYLSCGSCLACRRGKPNACSNISVLGVHADGGLCELLAVPEGALIDAQGLSVDDAALLEFLAIGAHAVARADVSDADRVLIVGAGPIGIGAALFSKLSGAAVTLTDRREARLAYARDRLGIADVIAADEDLESRLKARTDGEFFDVVFDATGAIPAMNEALKRVGHGGKLVFVGVNPGDLTISDPEFHKRETTLLASRNALDADFQRVIAALKSGEIDAAALRTHSLSLDEVPAKLPYLIKIADEVLKAVVEV